MVFGALSCALMAVAALYAQGHLRVRITAAAWQQLYSAHFVCTAGCGAYYLWLGYRQTGAVPKQGILDFAVGIFFYTVLFLAANLLLAASRVPPWSAVFPGLFLIYYGWVLWKGS
jgi:hypothetical protein